MPAKDSLVQNTVTLSAALRLGQALGVHALDVQLLLLKALGKNPTQRTTLYTTSDAGLKKSELEIFKGLLGRRIIGEPIAYLTGYKEFFGRDFYVNRDVLVPRPETEVLVEWCLELIARCQDRPLAVADLGTGSGVIAITLALSDPTLSVTGVDSSAASLAVSKTNAGRLGATVEWRRGSWFSALGEAQQFDFIVSNPPYIGSEEPALTNLCFEPRGALTPKSAKGSGLSDGLADLRKITRRSLRWLRTGGALLMEHGAEHGVLLRQEFARSGLVQIETRRDLAGKERVTCGFKL